MRFKLILKQRFIDLRNKYNYPLQYSYSEGHLLEDDEKSFPIKEEN